MAEKPKQTVEERGNRPSQTGVVTSDKMEKTITVKVERLVRHPQFGKYIRKYTTCKAHDEKREAKIGDLVEVVETRPLSKSKRWRLVKIVKKGAVAVTPKEEKPAPQAPPPKKS